MLRIHCLIFAWLSCFCFYILQLCDHLLEQSGLVKPSSSSQQDGTGEEDEVEEAPAAASSSSASQSAGLKRKRSEQNLAASGSAEEGQSSSSSSSAAVAAAPSEPDSLVHAMGLDSAPTYDSRGRKQAPPQVVKEAVKVLSKEHGPGPLLTSSAAAAGEDKLAQGITCGSGVFSGSWCPPASLTSSAIKEAAAAAAGGRRGSAVSVTSTGGSVIAPEQTADNGNSSSSSSSVGSRSGGTAATYITDRALMPRLARALVPASSRFNTNSNSSSSDSSSSSSAAAAASSSAAAPSSSTNDAEASAAGSDAEAAEPSENDVGSQQQEHPSLAVAPSAKGGTKFLGHGSRALNALGISPAIYLGSAADAALEGAADVAAASASSAPPVDRETLFLAQAETTTAVAVAASLSQHFAQSGAEDAEAEVSFPDLVLVIDLFDARGGVLRLPSPLCITRTVVCLHLPSASLPLQAEAKQIADSLPGFWDVDPEVRLAY